jgi:hypothetical protein
MIALFFLVLTLSVSPFKSKSRLEAENAALRHQLIVLQRRVRGRVQLTNGDRLFLVLLYRWFPSVLRAITIIRPDKSDLKPGAKVFIAAATKQPDGTLQARAWRVGRDGVTPPM